MSNVLSIAIFLRYSFVPHPNVRLNLFRAIKAVSFLFQDKRISHLGMLFIILQAGWSLYMQGDPLIVDQQYHLNTMHIWWFFSIIGVSVMFSIILVQTMAFQHFQLKTVYGVNITIAGALLVFNVLTPTLTTEWIIVILASLTQIICYGAIMTLFYNAVSEHEQSIMIGGSGAILVASWAINALFIGVLVNLQLYLLIFAAVLCLIISGLGVISYRAAQVMHE